MCIRDRFLDILQQRHLISDGTAHFRNEPIHIGHVLKFRSFLVVAQDVYKRQALTGRQPADQAAPGKSCALITRGFQRRGKVFADPSAPVSYTHLDVYKRQATGGFR